MDALIQKLLPDLREKRRLSRSGLSRLTVKQGYAGIPEGTIKAIETKPGRVPELNILEALANALEVAPETFYEYPIALARASGSAEALERELAEADAQDAARDSNNGRDAHTAHPQAKAQ